MKIIFDKYGGIKDIQDRKLLVQTSIGSNFVDIYYQDEEGNFADPDINLATIAFKRADTFEISERTCALVKEELTNNPLYFRYIFKEDELAINGELQMTVRLKQVVFDPEDDSKVLLIKQRAMGKITAHIYEAIGGNYENFDVVDGRILQLELWQANFESDYYNADQIDAKLVLERQATNDSLDDHNTSNEAHEDIRQTIENLDNTLQEQIDTINGTLSEHDFRINELEDFASNLETDITEEIEQALSGKADLVDGKVPLEQLPPIDNEITKEEIEAVLTGDITSHNHATEHNTSETAHSDIRQKVDEAKAIAEGKSRARVFATKSALDTWLLDSENVALLQIGDNFYIEETDKPDYWWNGTTIKELETQKVDLTEYAKKTELLTLGTTSNDAYRGDLGQIAYNHSQSAHAPSNAQKNVQSDWNQTDNTKDDYIKNKPTIPTKTSDLTNDSGFLTSLPTHNHDDRYYTESEIDTKLDGKADSSHTHTKSEITDFPTTMPPTAHNHDSDYYKKSETYSKAQTDALVGNLQGQTQELKSITTQPSGTFEVGDLYYNSTTKGMYYWTGTVWELTGLGEPIAGVIYSFNGILYFWDESTENLIQIGGGVDLSNYYTKTEVDNAIDTAILDLIGGES